MILLRHKFSLDFHLETVFELITCLSFSTNFAHENLMAFFRQSGTFHCILLALAIAPSRLLGDCFSKNMPVWPSIIISCNPPFLYAMTGMPQADASIAAIPKSSS